VDADGSPVTVSWSGDSRRNVIVWMDHRAVAQAERINSHHSPVLQYCGGALSPEMQPPKVSYSNHAWAFCTIQSCVRFLISSCMVVAYLVSERSIMLGF
jgi:ribulose kinase